MATPIPLRKKNTAGLFSLNWAGVTPGEHARPRVWSHRSGATDGERQRNRSRSRGRLQAPRKVMVGRLFLRALNAVWVFTCSIKRAVRLCGGVALAAFRPARAQDVMTKESAAVVRLPAWPTGSHAGQVRRLAGRFRGQYLASDAGRPLSLGSAVRSPRRLRLRQRPSALAAAMARRDHFSGSGRPRSSPRTRAARAETSHRSRH